MVATTMEALLAHRGALVHVDHSHRLERRARARAGASPSAPRGHQEVPTATPAYVADVPVDLWENMLNNAATEDCQSLKQLCVAVQVLCRAANAPSPCNDPEFWKDQ